MVGTLLERAGESVCGEVLLDQVLILELLQESLPEIGVHMTDEELLSRFFRHFYNLLLFFFVDV